MERRNAVCQSHVIAGLSLRELNLTSCSPIFTNHLSDIDIIRRRNACHALLTSFPSTWRRHADPLHVQSLSPNGEVKWCEVGVGWLTGRSLCHSFLISTLGNGEWSVSCPCLFISGEGAASINLIACVILRAGFDRSKRTKTSLELKPGHPARSQALLWLSCST
jgi:hypothetical protein